MFLFMSCNQAGEKSSADFISEVNQMTSGGNEADSRTASKEMAFNDDQQPGQAQQVANEQKLIRKAYLEMEVNSYDKAKTEIQDIIKNAQGSIEKSEDRSSSYRKVSNMTIRIAPEKLDEMVEKLAAVGRNIDRKAIESEDVTRQYIDMETRLKSKRAVVERYQQLLQQAKNVQEVLQVEENLRKVTEEIESTEAQFRYLSQQIDRSTIYLTFYEPIENVSSSGPSFGKRIGNAIRGGWQFLLNTIILFIEIWPLTILLIAGIVLFIRRRRRRKKQA